VGPELFPVQIALAWLIRKGAFPIPGVKTESQAEDIAKAVRQISLLRRRTC